MALSALTVSLPGAVAGEAFTASDLYTVVAISDAATYGDYTIVKVGHADAGPNIGVLYSYGGAGESVQVVIGGIAKFKSAGALVPGAAVPNLDGATRNATGMVMTESTGSGQIIEILIR